MQYAELHCVSNFTFLRGASHPEELVRRAADLGYSGLALTDECSVAGVVRAHSAARDLPLQFIVGSEFKFPDSMQIVALAVNRQSYGALCNFISSARRSAEKGAYRATSLQLIESLSDSGCLILWPVGSNPDFEIAKGLKERLGDRLWLAVEYLADGTERQIFAAAKSLSGKLGIPMVASGNVHMHCRRRRMLQDTLTAIKKRKPLEELGFDLYSNAERCLKSIGELYRRYPQGLLTETIKILERVDFSLDELRYEYPDELVPGGQTPAAYLRELTERGMRLRWPARAPAKVVSIVEHELKLIRELKYEAYFLTVYDIVRFARSRGILCQGRGSAANSAVCYCLGITEVDPSRIEMLVERFISKERNEPPDIDVDFEHERREEVIQYIYERYSRERAALAATVITYQPRSALRDVSKALGFNEAQAGSLAKSLQWWDGPVIEPQRVKEAGLDPSSRKVRQLVYLVKELIGFPRHLSQHVGGFVISAGPLSRLVPIENATMPERTVIQWDKDDLAELGLLKIDILGLGMLSAIRRSFELYESFHGRRLSMQDIPPDDPRVYQMISRADTIGVFQIESRAQMAMLPRLKPRCYYDLVIEVAIIRPGPIQGDMVHPYLRRRNGEERVTYPSIAVRKVLQRTLGVPIFQEQVMQLAVVAAGFTPGEADQLRRAMAAWRRSSNLGLFETRLIDGMLTRGYSRKFAERIFAQIKGFGEYGFPESHAASFALLVYVSAWIKCHEPAIFVCALLNSQPMGFYAPAQLVRSAKEHGVEVRPVDAAISGWDCTLERDASGMPAIRLGLRLVKGLSEAAGRRIVVARQNGEIARIHELARHARLDARDLAALAAANAFRSFAANRFQARWQVAGIDKPTPLFWSAEALEATPLLRVPSEGETVSADYRHIGLSLERHPLALLRTVLDEKRVCTAQAVQRLGHGQPVVTAGLVVTRQRPSSASGVTFVTLEDETGYLNLIVWESIAQRDRRVLLGASLMGVSGKVQKEGEVLHVIAQCLHDYSSLLGGLTVRSRDFH